jgi:DNA primase catalytic core
MITDWINNTLYPYLFDSLDTALPELNLERFSKGWRSSLKLDLSNPKKSRKDKTVVTKRVIGRILEQGQGVANLSIIDYVMSRDSISFIEAVNKLANIVGLQVPKGDYEDYRKDSIKANLLEDANSYFIYSLETLEEAKETKEYLLSRGYKEDYIKDMELGYIPSQERLTKYLLSRGHTAEDIKDFVLGTKIGKTHNLSIPYRTGSYIKGFKFRTIGEDNPKYLNSTGLDKSVAFFNLSGLKGDKDIVIVEGELDSLHATVQGVENVVSIAGFKPSKEQVQNAIKRGAKSFTICLDREPHKEEETIKTVNEVIEIILNEGVNKVYIVTLPDLGGGKTDPDRLIKEKGVESFKEAIKEAIVYYKFYRNQIIQKYAKIEETTGKLTDKDRDNLIDEIKYTGLKIKDPIYRDRFIKNLTSYQAIKDLGITEDSLKITIDRLQYKEDTEQKEKELKRILSKASELQAKGQTDEALELLESKLPDIKLQDKGTLFSDLLKPIEENEVKQRQALKPEGVNSGYIIDIIDKDEVIIPAGAISVIAGATSHGKTALLINLALNIVQDPKEGEVYFFSYEEDSDAILLKALNTYIDEELSQNNRRSIQSYFKTGSTEFIETNRRDIFIRGKDRFFKELIDSRKLNIHYCNYNSDRLIEAIRYLHKHAKPKAIIIDYIQLLNLPEGKFKTYSRQEEIKQICIALKDLTIETGLPIILGAQFNREVVNHLKVHATNIGEAGDIERIANLILGIWNCNKTPITNKKNELKEIEPFNTPNTIYTKVLKNRGGKSDIFTNLKFNGNTGKIINW